jgi:hypothetical protein
MQQCHADSFPPPCLLHHKGSLSIAIQPVTVNFGDAAQAPIDKCAKDPVCICQSGLGMGGKKRAVPGLIEASDASRRLKLKQKPLEVIFVRVSKTLNYWY